MTKKTIIISSVVASIITLLLLLSIALFLGIRYYVGTTKVVDTLNLNLSLRQEANNQLVGITGKIKPKANANTFDLASLETAKTDLVTYKEDIATKKSQLQSGDFKDLQKSYDLYNQLFDAYSTTASELLQTTKTLACITQKSDALQTSLKTTELMFTELGTIQDTALLADKTGEVGLLFTANAALYADTKTCFSSEDQKVLFQNANNGSSVDIETATSDLGSLFIGLSDAIRAEDLTKIQQANTAIQNITQSSNVDFTSQYSEALDIESKKIDRSLEILTAKSTLLDKELDVINEKYNLISVNN